MKCLVQKIIIYESLLNIDNHYCCEVWDHMITLEVLEFVLNMIEKVKTGFLLSTVYTFSELNGTKS